MTSTSLKKLEEMEVEARLRMLREMRSRSLKKNIENNKKVMFSDEYAE
jgi:hypothetical protein